MTRSNGNPRRLLMVTNTIGFGGGAEEQIMSLSLGLRARGWLVRIVSLLPLYPVWKELEASGIELVSLNMKRGIPDPRALLKLRKEIRRFRPDIVHCHMPQANLLARCVRVFARFPVLINTLHNVTMERINGSSGRFLEIAHRFTDRLSDTTTVICTPAVKSYVESRAVPQNKIAVVYNGIDTNLFRPDLLKRQTLRRELLLDGNFVWLAMARFELAKDYPNLIRAFEKIIRRGCRNTKLLICGRGSLEASIKERVRESGIGEHVRFLGVRTDVCDVMNAADGFVLSSYLEGLPMVLLQAASIGIPIVATNVGGNSEVVTTGVNGLLVPPSDDEALACAMRKILTLPVEELDSMARRGRELAQQRFELERVLNRWEAVYEERSIERKRKEQKYGKELSINC